jgi:pSer/pThr/pTyr-binding forkhead associated (FHA) protein
MEVKLVVAHGPLQGRVVPLPPTVFLIGRGPRCHLRPHCRLVSKLHCAIARWAGKVVVRDLKSANGTFVNDCRVQGETRVNDGDTLKVGTLAFTFRIHTGDEVLPFQVILPGDVQWLMDEPSDSPVLRVIETQRVDVCSMNLGAPDEPGTLSAGEYLRDHLRPPNR